MKSLKGNWEELAKGIKDCFKNGLKQHRLTICNHAKAAKKALRKQDFDIIFLDHDLRGKPEDPDSDNCGTEVARYIVDHEIAPQEADFLFCL